MGHTHGPALRLLGRHPALLGRMVARVVGRLRGAPDATRAHVAPWRQRRGAVARLRGGNRPGGTDRAPRRVVSEPPPRGNGRHGPHPEALPRRLAQGRRPIAPSPPGAPMAWWLSRRAEPVAGHPAPRRGAGVTRPARAARATVWRGAPGRRRNRVRIAAVVGGSYCTLAGRSLPYPQRCRPVCSDQCAATGLQNV